MSYVIHKLCNYLWIITSWLPFLLIKGGSYSSGMKWGEGWILALTGSLYPYISLVRLDHYSHQLPYSWSFVSGDEKLRLGGTIGGHFLWGTWASRDFDVKGGPGTMPSRHQGTSSPSLISSQLSALDKRYSNFSEHQKHPEDLFKPRPQRSAPRISDWVNLMRHLKPARWTSFYMALESMREHTLQGLYNCFRLTQRNNSEAERGRAKDGPHLAQANHWVLL